MRALSHTLCAFAASQDAGVGVGVRTLVLGMGVTGQSVARWLARNSASATFFDHRSDADTDLIAAALPEASLLRGAPSNDLLETVDQVIASPGIPEHDAIIVRARECGVPVLSDIELFVREARAPIVAVTGSNGKSTVVTLLQAMCDQAGVTAFAGANLGTPVLDLPVADEDAFYLLELSSFQLQRTQTLHAYAACVLNISADHLDWHDSMQDYSAAKLSVYRHCEFAVINADAGLDLTGVDANASTISFTLGEPDRRQFGVVMHDDEPWLAFGADVLMPVSRCGLKGRHNVANILAALSLGSALDLPLSAMLAAVRAFGGLDHRHQRVAVRNGVEWINDSKATNAGAALASVAAVDAPTVLLIGGRAKGDDPQPFVDALPESVRLCIVYGENSRQLASALRVAGRKFQIADDLAAAVQLAATAARVGEVVLLAPAAASHDAFANYKARGEQFAILVEALD